MKVERIIPLQQLEELEQLASSGELTESELRAVSHIISAVTNFEQTHPIQAYEPTPATRSGGPHQLTFHTSELSGRAIFGGNQSGKTKAGSMEAAFHFTGEYPSWYPVKMRLKPRNIGRIMAVDFAKSITEVIEPALKLAVSDKHIAEWKRNTQGHFYRAVSKTGSRFDCVTHDMPTKSLEGWQGDWFWMDEPPPRDKYIATIRGLIRRAGRWWLTCTPLSEPWLYDDIYTNSEFLSITIDIRDNPYLSEDQIAKFEAELTEDEKEARLHGKFMHLSGLTYKEFDPSVHIKSSSTVIPPEWPRWCVCDPHDRRPFAFIWFAVDPMDRIWIYDEWPKGWFHEMKASTKSLKDYVHILNEMEIGQHIYRRIIDGRACKAPLLVGTESGEHQDTLLDAFDDLGLTPPFEPSYITTTLGITDPGHLKVKEMLRVSLVTGEPSLFILDNCKNVIYSFQHNVWEDFRDSTQGIKERQSQFAKDFLDLIRYGVMDNPHWMEQNDWQRESSTHPSWVERNAMERGDFGGYGA